MKKTEVLKQKSIVVAHYSTGPSVWSMMSLDVYWQADHLYGNC